MRRHDPMRGNRKCLFVKPCGCALRIKLERLSGSNEEIGCRVFEASSKDMNIDHCWCSVSSDFGKTE